MSTDQTAAEAVRDAEDNPAVQTALAFHAERGGDPDTALSDVFASLQHQLNVVAYRTALVLGAPGGALPLEDIDAAFTVRSPQPPEGDWFAQTKPAGLSIPDAITWAGLARQHRDIWAGVATFRALSAEAAAEGALDAAVGG